MRKPRERSTEEGAAPLKRRRRDTEPRPVIGWREWIVLPELDIPAIKAKVDTGARSSSLHAYDVQIFRVDGVDRVRFKVHPFQRDSKRTVAAEHDLLEQRWVKSSGGHETLRPVILAKVELMGRWWPIELTLMNRDTMGFRMLLGRQAVRERFVVDPGRSYVAGKGPAASGKKERSSKKGPSPS